MRDMYVKFRLGEGTMISVECGKGTASLTIPGGVEFSYEGDDLNSTKLENTIKKVINTAVEKAVTVEPQPQPTPTAEEKVEDSMAALRKEIEAMSEAISKKFDAEEAELRALIKYYNDIQKELHGKDDQPKAKACK